MVITKWLRYGNLCGTQPVTTDDLIEAAGIVLDKHESHEILGELVFVADDGKTYVMTVEAVIAEAHPDYVQSVMTDSDD